MPLLGVNELDDHGELKVIDSLVQVTSPTPSPMQAMLRIVGRNEALHPRPDPIPTLEAAVLKVLGLLMTSLLGTVTSTLFFKARGG
ncbi:uncharacterized protein BDR25DRAFT_305180 [Lindgomyces ingoldianus]|uniref:Uncharacterized protein n=1 Tax=Lindgomyces ingoldianus TaxID=673940 RepID=A0ACB6QMI8_9PLEO|nr:uncharacterized protein BDR25DRAFT_305180 [Lindgomyces ingoldianus]KAF2468189.1 hypothetical protein BDR25DRAFT_305180 [Lindgomyces ingoldianus]